MTLIQNLKSHNLLSRLDEDQLLDLDRWPRDLKINHLLSSQPPFQNWQAISIRRHLNKNHIFWQFSRRGVKKYRGDRIWTKTSSLTLTFDYVNWKSAGVICYQGASCVWSLANLKQRDLKYIERTGQKLYKDQGFDIDL